MTISIGTRYTAIDGAAFDVSLRYPGFPVLAGDAWITGEHTFLVDKHDPLRRGFRL